MDTVLEILRKTTEYFGRKGLPSPRLEAEWLLAHTLGLKGRLELYLQYERPLDGRVLDRLRELVRQRAARVPLQHLLGEVEFHGLKLKVDGRALIPRPETEELVEKIIASTEAAPATILDLGTGSGALALALAAAYPQARVVAVDRSSQALALAGENAGRHPGLAGRLELRQSDWWQAVTGRFDLVVSNPPYLTAEEWTSAQPEVRAHDPHEALVAEEDGLADLREILAGAPQHLNPGGRIWLETGIHHHEALAELARMVGFAEWAGLADLAGRPRFFMARLAGAEAAT